MIFNVFLVNLLSMFSDLAIINETIGKDVPMSTSSVKAANNKVNRPTFLFIIAILMVLSVSSIVFMAREHMVTVQGSSINIRTGPGLSHEMVTEINPGTPIQVLDRQGQWLKVTTKDNQIGWTPSWLFNQTPSEDGEKDSVLITKTGAKVYEKADQDSQVIATLNLGETLELVSETNGFVQVKSGDQTGWVSTYHATSDSDQWQKDMAARPKVVIQGLETNVRSQPSTESEKVGTASAYESYPYIQTIRDWHQIQLDEETIGFVADYLVVVEGLEDVQEDTPSLDRAIPPLSEATIVIDAGHGGNDPGALGESVVEKDITLSTAHHLKALLADTGAEVILTRDDDSYVYLSDRLADSFNSHADVFLSLHYDASATPNSMSGTTTYYFHNKDLRLAQLVNDHLANQGPLSNNGVRIGDYYVLRNNARASLLLELGFMNHDIDYSYIETDEYHQVAAQAIYQALVEYFK